MVTHVVDNQPPEFAPRDLWGDDVVLRDALRAKARRRHRARRAYGAIAGGELLALSHDAHRDRPRLRTHDRSASASSGGVPPQYHRLMQSRWSTAWPACPGRSPARVRRARAALSYLHHQVEPGTSCPLTMTHAAVPVLRQAPRLREWADKVASCRYDASDLAIHAKPGVTIGMGMTEKQGGSDVRANATTATPLADGDAVAGDAYVLRGHKWFFSAPMSDGFWCWPRRPVA